MAEIIVVSDSHKHNATLNQIFKAHSTIDTCIHCGDIQDHAEKLNIKNLYIVSGNTDYDINIKDLTIQIDNYKIYICHGHQHFVEDGLEPLKLYACDNNIHLVCFGHTHKAMFINDKGHYFLNPGSVAFPRGGLFLAPSYAILTLDESEIKCTFYHARTNEPLIQNGPPTKKKSFFERLKNKNH